MQDALIPSKSGLKVAIMQPYFFPYIGYFQLMAMVDCFVVYDDAQFMKNGWVNRNRILRARQPAWWTFPVVRDDFQLPIRQRCYSRPPGQIRSLLGKLEGAYRDAPRYSAVVPAIADLLNLANDNVAEFNRHLLEGVAALLGIKCQFLNASELEPLETLGGQERVLDICRRLGATEYMNPIGGLELYDGSSFSKHDINLAFLKAKPVVYEQFGGEFVPFLSIVDVMMFNSSEQIKALIGEHVIQGPAR